jgi:serine/threonine protein kinase
MSGEVLQGRFEVGAQLGRGAQGVTYLGRDRETGAGVVIKELDVGSASDWKAIELFEREGRALAALDHPNIPSYVDAFHVQADGEERFFLVQEHVEGESLADWIARGERVDEAAAREMARQLLEIARYIHGLNPQIVHRDIKPSNIIRGEDGRLSLVDFGAVQTLAPEATGGSTVVGTSGYMPVEQLMGRATGATDLYAIGATLVHVLSHTHPNDMDVEFMRLRFEPHVNVSPEFEGLLAKLLEPHVENRVQTAEEALAWLDGRRRTPEASPAATDDAAEALEGLKSMRNGGLMKDPKGTLGQLSKLAQMVQGSRNAWQSPLYEGAPPEVPKVTTLGIERGHEQVDITIPKAGLTKSPVAMFSLLWNGIVWFMITVMVLANGFEWFFMLFMSLFVLVGLATGYMGLKGATTSHQLKMTREALEMNATGLFGSKTRRYTPDEIDSVEFASGGSVNGESIWDVVLKTANEKHKFLHGGARKDQLFVASTLRDWAARELFTRDGGVTFDFGEGAALEDEQDRKEEKANAW